MQNTTENKFWQFDTDYWFKKLASSNKGLSPSAAATLLRNSGNNNKQESRFQKEVKLFFGQFKSPLMLLLIGAVILSGFLADKSDEFIVRFRAHHTICNWTAIGYI